MTTKSTKPKIPAKRNASPAVQAPSVPAAVSPSLQAAALPNLWSKDLLLTKTHRYVEKMMENDRSTWEFGFWSTLVLEFLLRASLAKVSPALLADTGKDWSHLYYALGYSPKASKFIPKSINVNEAVSRVAEINPAFDSRLSGFCMGHLARRNEEFHTGGTPFDEIETSQWQPAFYEACEVLMVSLSLTLSDLVGPTEARMAASTIAAAEDESAKAVLKDVQQYLKQWEKLQPADRAKSTAQAAVWANKQDGHRVECPACKSTALVTGRPYSPPTVRYDEDSIKEVQEFLPSRFECVACGLKIAGLAKLHVCGLANVYKSTSVYDPADYYSASYSWDDYAPDNND